MYEVLATAATRQVLAMNSKTRQVRFVDNDNVVHFYLR